MIDKSYTKEELIKGLDTYTKINNSYVDDLVSHFEEDGVSLEEFIKFLRFDFLNWMKLSRLGDPNWEIKDIKEVYYSITIGGGKDIKKDIGICCRLDKIGLVCASGILGILKPDKYGIVSKYTRVALSVTSCTIKNVVEIEEYLRGLAEKYSAIEELYTPRKIDKALWGVANN